MLKKILIIPARIGSKRIKEKNIKYFCGKPIINYSIESALKSKLFDEIHVSTDSEKVKSVVKKYPININFLRPKKISNDVTPLMKVFDFVVSKYMKKNIIFDEIWYLMPCSPLITYSDLVDANKFSKKIKTNSLLAISKFSSPIERAIELNREKKLSFLNKNKIKCRTQDLNEYYHDTGTFGMFKSEVFYNKKKVNFSGYILPQHKSIDIDNLEDWNLAKALFTSKLIN
mgnify:CR=1 FL=1